MKKINWYFYERLHRNIKTGMERISDIYRKAYILKRGFFLTQGEKLAIEEIKIELMEFKWSNEE